jgi:hypothetical protein
MLDTGCLDEPALSETHQAIPVCWAGGLCSQSRLSILTNAHFREWGRPVASASFEVGPSPAAVLQPGDQLSFHRLGTGDIALTIMRNESLVLGLGSLVGLPLGREIQVAEDIRLKELRLYDLAGDFDRMDDLEAHVIWIDVGQGNLRAQLEVMNRTPRTKHLIVAIKEGVNEAGEYIVPRGLYDKLLEYSKADCTSYYQVDAQFATKQAWINYVKALPRGRPKDLHLSFATGHERIELCEGEEAFIKDYYVRVERVHRRGLPGELSSLVIARMSSALTKDMASQSASLMANARWA